MATMTTEPSGRHLPATNHSSDDDCASASAVDKIGGSRSSGTRPFVYVLTALSAIGGFLFGYDTGVVSGAMLLVRVQFRLRGDPLWQEMIVSATIAAAWIFSLVGGILVDVLGRKPVIVAASFVFTVGAVVMAVSNTKEVLLIGRVIVGIGIGLVSCSVPVYIAESAPRHLRSKLVTVYVAMVGGGQITGALVAAACTMADPSHGWRYWAWWLTGLASMSVPMYLAELSSPDIRGRLVTVNNVFITGGQFVASVVCGLFSSNHSHGWRFMLGLSGIPAIVQFVGFLGMPESPRWLVQKGRRGHATAILRTIRGSDFDVDAEVDAIQRSCEETEQEEEGRSVLIDILQTPSVRRALLVGCALSIFQQLAGINTVMYYSATIIQMSGVKDTTMAVWLSAATASVNFLFTFLGLYLVEKVGRRPLTLGSLGGTIASLILLAVGFQLATLNAPAVTFHEQSPLAHNDTCSTYRSCASCTDNAACGFCYDTIGGGTVLNGSCVSTMSATDDVDSASYGRCSNASFLGDGVGVFGTVTDGGDHQLSWDHGFCPSPYHWLPIFGLCLYLVFFAPGMGPMPWTINSEIYPLWARGTCYAISTSFNWLFNLAVSMTFLTLTDALTKYGAFYLYAGISLTGWIFFFVALPETRGKTLEEVEGLFAQPLCCGGKAGGGILPAASSDRTVQYVHIRGLNIRDRQDSNDSGDDI